MEPCVGVSVALPQTGTTQRQNSHCVSLDVFHSLCLMTVATINKTVVKLDLCTFFIALRWWKNNPGERGTAEARGVSRPTSDWGDFTLCD